jgi:ABC-type glycerol-3-phosphate transport system substrate-binding protein
MKAPQVLAGATTTITPSPLISTFVTTPSASGDYLSAATNLDLYKEKVTTYVNQRTNQKFSKETLARDFTKKTGNAFKMACAKMSFDEAENQLKMPLMR